MNRIFITLMTVFSVLMFSPVGVQTANAAAPVPAATPAHRVVIQLNENDSHKLNTIFGNINNVLEELGQVDVTVVVIGPALEMIKAEALTANRVLDAMSAGVRFVACLNSMKAQNLHKEDMIDNIAYAKAGYVEIMRLQEQGWSYLRP